MKAKNTMIIGGIFLLLAVALGAFGTHALERTLSTKLIATYKTGVTYQFYHGFALLFLAVISLQTKLNLKKPILCFIFGIILFSFNCYGYALTQIKTLAMIIPTGGTLFVMGWFLFIKQILCLKDSNE